MGAQYRQADRLYWIDLNAAGMSALLTGPAAMSSRVWTPLDRVTVGDAVLEATRAFIQNNPDSEIFEEILEPRTVGRLNSLMPTRMEWWWMNFEPLWQVWSRLIKTQGPPVKFYENAFGQIVFADGRHGYGPFPIGEKGIPMIGSVVMSDHIEDVSNDVIVPRVLYGWLLPASFETADSLTNLISSGQITQQQADELRAILQGKAPSGAFYPGGDEPLYTNPQNSMMVLPKESRSRVDEETGGNYELLLYDLLFDNGPELIQHSLSVSGGITPGTPATGVNPFAYRRIPPGGSTYIVQMEQPVSGLAAPVYRSTRNGTVAPAVRQLGANTFEVVFPSLSGQNYEPLTLIYGTTLKSFGGSNLRPSRTAIAEEETQRSRRLFRYRLRQYEGYPVLSFEDSRRMADWMLRWYRQSLPYCGATLRSTYLLTQAALIQPMVRVDFSHPQWGEQQMIVRQVTDQFMGGQWFQQVVLERDLVRAVPELANPPMLDASRYESSEEQSSRDEERARQPLVRRWVPSRTVVLTEPIPQFARWPG